MAFGTLLVRMLGAIRCAQRAWLDLDAADSAGSTESP